MHESATSSTVTSCLRRISAELSMIVQQNGDTPSAVFAGDQRF